MDGLGLLVAFASFVMVLIALNKNSKLETRFAQLKLQFGNLADEIAKLRRDGVTAFGEEAAAPQPEAAIAEVEATARTDAAEAAPSPFSETAAAEAAVEPAISEPARPPRDVEQALASRWFVWIGGAAIAIGGLLFVKYAYDNELISPALQVTLGLLLGLALVGAGEFVRRKSPVAMAGSYVPAALSAAGLATAFGSIYAAYALYELIASTVAFGGLAVVAVGALVLSRVQGPLIAALGLIGSYVTPALIPSEHPSAWNFFPYLLVIVAASFGVLRGRNWWWLAYAAIGRGGRLDAFVGFERAICGRGFFAYWPLCPRGGIDRFFWFNRMGHHGRGEWLTVATFFNIAAARHRAGGVGNRGNSAHGAGSANQPWFHRLGDVLRGDGTGCGVCLAQAGHISARRHCVRTHFIHPHGVERRCHS